MTIKEKYQQACTTPSDINEHLPTLKRYADQCETICELGVRGVVSTWAFLASNAKKVIGVDIDWHPAVLDAYKMSIVEGKVFEFVLGNDLKYEMPEVSMIFFDSLHTYSQLSNELRLHGNKASMYLGFHDTTSFFDHGENAYEAVFHTAMNDGKGIWPAIEEFLQSNPHWTLAERFHNNNGLTVLKRLYM